MKLTRLFYIAVYLVILVGIAQPVSAQRNSAKRPEDKAWVIGAKGAAIISFGDVKYWDYIPNLEYGELGYGAHLSFGKYFSPKYGLKTDLSYSVLHGAKRTSSLLMNFETKAQSASLQFQINIGEFLNRRPRLNRLSLWGDLGIGYIRWQSILYNYRTHDTIDQINWGTNKYMSSLMIPAGLNIRYYLSKKWSVDAHASAVIVNSDLLDDKSGGIEYDYFVNAGIGFNYHFLIQKSIRNVPVELKRNKGDLNLLDYMNIDPFSDPEIERITKREQIKQQEEKVQSLIDEGNPFNVEFWVPEKANNKKFKILVSIKKRGITGNGYFRLSLPSGFYPVQPDVKEVTYTRIAYNYDFDFYLPMNLDTLNIPIDITVSEREDGTYPVFIEGEIMDSDGNLFPLKKIQYVQLKTGVSYNEVPINNEREELKAEEPDEGYIAPSNVTNILEEADGDKTYRIQILACRKPSERVNEFLKKHHIDQKVYLWEKGGWWRYSIYNLSSMEEAKEYLLMVRNKHGIKGAFIVEFFNGERLVPGGQPSRSASRYSDITSSENSTDLNRSFVTSPSAANTNTANETSGEVKPPAKKESDQDKKEIKEESIEKKPLFEEVKNTDNISVYRIEIAVSPANPIPLRQLQNWVANEKIYEWTYQKEYRYTIGRFENEQVARAFLRYVQVQFALPDAHLVETKGQNWLRVVR